MPAWIVAILMPIAKWLLTNLEHELVQAFNDYLDKKKRENAEKAALAAYHAAHGTEEEADAFDNLITTLKP